MDKLISRGDGGYAMERVRSFFKVFLLSMFLACAPAKAMDWGQVVTTLGVQQFLHPGGFLKNQFGPLVQALSKILKQQKATTARLYGALNPRIEKLLETLLSRYAFQIQTMTEEEEKTPYCALLHGKPGGGKTLLARTMADRLHALYIEQSGSDFLTSLQAGGVQAVKDIFEQARTLRNIVRYVNPDAHTPVVICIDEIDRILLERGSGGTHGHDRTDATTQFLTELTSPQNEGLLVIGTTNRYQTIDSAALRTGRLGSCIVEVGAPDEHARKAILTGLIKTKQNELQALKVPGSEGILDLDTDRAVEDSEGLMASDLKEAVKHAYLKLSTQEIAAGRHIDRVARIASNNLKLLLSIVTFLGGGKLLYQFAGKPLVHWCQNKGIDYYVRKVLREPLTHELIEKVGQGYRDRTTYFYTIVRNLIMVFGWKFVWPLLHKAIYHRTTHIHPELATEPTAEMLQTSITEIKEEKARLAALKEEEAARARQEQLAALQPLLGVLAQQDQGGDEQPEPEDA